MLRTPIFSNLAIFTATLLMFSSGCVNREASLKPLIPSVADSNNYFKELKDWRKSKKIYANLDIRCYVHVTYLSQPLMRSYVKEYAAVYDLSLAEQQKLYDEKVVAEMDKDTFFVSIFAPADNWAQLSATDNTWKLRAIYDQSDEEVAPLAVQEVAADDPKITYFFPYAEQWSRHYRVILPAKRDASKVKFVMRGVLGGESFTWPRGG